MTESEDLRRFEALVLPHLDAAYNLARWLARDPDDARDIVQEACLRAWRYFASCREGEARPWLLGIVRNTLLGWRRRQAEVIPFGALEREDGTAFIEDVAGPGDDPEAIIGLLEERALIDRLIERLPPAFREALVAAHIRSLEPGHGIDVPSSDRHTVKPWFDGRVAFSPPVKDLSEAGFALVGGRRDHVDHHEAAVLVYHRREHRIDLFVWPAADGRPAPAAATSDGYHVRLWTEGGFALAAVSNLDPAELDEFVRRWRAA